MSNVVHFRRECVTIDTGIVTASDEPSEVGGRIYLVEYVDASGGTLDVFHSFDHATALAAAVEWHLPILDKTEGRAE